MQKKLPRVSRSEGSDSHIKIPQRVTLLSRTVDSLRQAIKEGEWVDYLPSARSLSRRLQVSWSTMRNALKILHHEGLIVTSRGNYPRVVQGKKSSRPSHTVVFLSHIRSTEASRLMVFARSELEHALHFAGFEVRESFNRIINKAKRLDQIVRQVDAACWVLFDSNREQQLYFANRGLPAFIVGHRYPDVKLPFMDINSEAVCRHATAHLLAKGHRNLALLLPEMDDAGLLVREWGFKKEIAAFAKDKAVGVVLRHRNRTDEKSMGKVLDSVFKKFPRPTALIVADPWHTITAISHLMSMGIQVPQEVSVISLDFELALNSYRPKIATYLLDYDAYAISLAKLVTRLAKTGSISLKPNWVFPEFLEHHTIAAPPKQESLKDGNVVTKMARFQPLALY